MTSKPKEDKLGPKSKEDASHELESQFVLRVPPEYATAVRRIVQTSNTNLKDRLTIEMHADGRHGIVRVDRVPLACKLVDLPGILESLKTVDKKTLYKTADISQMLVCTRDGDLYPPLEESTGSTDSKSKKKDMDKDNKFLWNHGLALPLKNMRKRRFRKTVKNQYIESPEVEKEVKRLLRTDAEAVSVRCEMIADDETREPSSISLSNLDFSLETLAQHELRQIFNDISSSSEEDGEEGEWHEEDHLDIMDTVDDMVRQLKKKRNKAEGGREEESGSGQMGRRRSISSQMLFPRQETYTD